MKRKYLFLLSVCFCMAGAGLSQGILFEEGSWEEVKAKAKATNRPIFVDAYTSWCVPCKVMAKNVFTKDSVGTYFNNTFINYQIDVEKGEGIAFGKQYDVNAYPTLLYFDPKGSLAFKAVGGKDVQGLLSQAELALNPEYQLATYKKEYEDAKKDLGKLNTYASKLRAGGSYNTATAVVTEHIVNMKDADKQTKDAWKLIYEYVYDYRNEVFEYVLKNRKKYAAVAGDSTVNKYIYHVMTGPRILIGGGRGTVPDSSRQMLNTYMNIVEKYSRYIDIAFFKARMNYLAHLNNNDSAYFYANQLMNKDYKMIYPDDKLPYFMAYMANRYINETGEKFESAVKWAERSVKLKPGDYKSMYVLAQLLHKQGKHADALKYGEKALAAYKQSSEAPVMRELFRADTIEAFVAEMRLK